MRRVPISFLAALVLAAAAFAQPPDPLTRPGDRHELTDMPDLPPHGG